MDDYPGFSCAVMDDVLPKIATKLQPGEKWKEQQYSRRSNTNSAIFQELEKGDVIAMKGYVTNG